MFGFSITKLLFTIAAVFLVWQGFKWYARAQQVKASRKAEMPPRSGGPGTAKAASTQDTVKCDVCDTYVPVGSGVSCGRDDCPYPG